GWLLWPMLGILLGVAHTGQRKGLVAEHEGMSAQVQQAGALHWRRGAVLAVVVVVIAAGVLVGRPLAARTGVNLANLTLLRAMSPDESWLNRPPASNLWAYGVSGYILPVDRHLAIEPAAVSVAVALSTWATDVAPAEAAAW